MNHSKLSGEIYLFLLVYVVQTLFHCECTPTLPIVLDIRYAILLDITWYKDDATFKTALCWRIVVAFHKTFQELTVCKLTRLSLASVQCIYTCIYTCMYSAYVLASIQFPEDLVVEFEWPWTQSSSCELILSMSCYYNSKMKVCIKNFNCKIKQWRKRGVFWTNTNLNSIPTVDERFKYFKCFPSNILIRSFCLKCLFECFRNLYLTSNFSYKWQWILVKLSNFSILLPSYKLNIASIKTCMMVPDFFSQNYTRKLFLCDLSRMKFCKILPPGILNLAFYVSYLEDWWILLCKPWLKIWFNCDLLEKKYYFGKKLPKLGKFCDFLVFIPVIYPLKKFWFFFKINLTYQ